MPPFPVVSPPGRDDPAPERFIPGLYSVTLVAFFGSVGLLWRIDGSPFGKALRAIRDNETRAEFVGIPVRRYRWRAFIISAAFTGLAGGLYGQLDRQVTPEQLHWVWSANSCWPGCSEGCGSSATGGRGVCVRDAPGLRAALSKEQT